LAVALDVGPVSADPKHDAGVLERERVQLAGVDVTKIVRQRAQALPLAI
jgi:hypothetical protein